MTATLMSMSQASKPWAALLARGAVQRIEASDHDRWLTVGEGELWLTTLGDVEQDGADIWLAPGEGVKLHAGVEAIVEARAEASFQLVEAAVLSPARGSVFWRRAARWLQRERFALQLGAVAAPCVG